ncbi:MAG: hypothetical protein ABEH61_02265 [Haloarculaceae archaeon]
MEVSRREVCHVAVAGLLLGSVPAAARAQSSELQLLSVELPETIEQGGTFGASATVRNDGSEEVTTEVGYSFENDLVASADLTLSPDEERTVRLPEMEYKWLTEGGTRTVPPGTYEHSIGVRNGPREAAEVEVVPGEDSTPGDTPAEGSGNTAPDDLQLVSRQLPERLARGEARFVGATVENTRSSQIVIDLTYAFRGREVFFEQGVEIPANTRQEIGFPEVTLSAIEESLGREIEPGTYEHSFGIPEGLRIEGQVEIGGEASADSPQAPTDDGTPEDGGSERSVTQEDVESSETGGGGRERGFFSNSGDSPDALSNPLNLTTLGFLLSVAGIAHQMLQGG